MEEVRLQVSLEDNLELFVFVDPAEFESNLPVVHIAFVLIDIVLCEDYLNEYSFLVRNTSIEFPEDDLHVYFLHESHHSIHYVVDEMIHY